EQHAIVQRPSEHRAGDARGECEVEKKKMRLRNVQAERGAGKERGGGDRGDGAHAQRLCKALTSRSSQRTQRAQRSEPKEFFLCVRRVLCVGERSDVADSARRSDFLRGYSRVVVLQRADSEPLLAQRADRLHGG